MKDLPEEYKDTPDIGFGVHVHPRFYDGVLHGFAYVHPRPDSGEWCEGWVPLRAGDESWDLISYDPLELSPSLLCRSCGHHGWIRNGNWVPA